MNAAKRREQLLTQLKSTKTPTSASALAAHFEVSRQIIVGDVALLRAEGAPISATARGYLYKEEQNPLSSFGYIGHIACRHQDEDLLTELYTVADFGGCIIVVLIEHSIYGQISAPVNVSSRYEADLFYEKVKQGGGRPLSDLTDGIHVHDIGCRSEETFQLIKNALIEKGIAFE